jgi:hypothetical protein
MGDMPGPERKGGEPTRLLRSLLGLGRQQQGRRAANSQGSLRTQQGDRLKPQVRCGAAAQSICAEPLSKGLKGERKDANVHTAQTMSRYGKRKREAEAKEGLTRIC